MKTSTPTQTKVKTFLPIFTGFYNNPYFDSDWKEKSELNYINELREDKGLKEVDYDDLKVDYETYFKETSIEIVEQVEKHLSDYVESIAFEKLVSPKYYNYTNDSIDCIIVPKKEAIISYLLNNEIQFMEYLKENYKSREGFISSYDYGVTEFMRDEPLEHKHKLGSILNFIAENEEIDESYLDIETYITITNFEELTK